MNTKLLADVSAPVVVAVLELQPSAYMPPDANAILLDGLFPCRFSPVVIGNANDLHPLVLVFGIHLFQMRIAFATRHTPARPEINQHILPAKIRETQLC